MVFRSAAALLLFLLASPAAAEPVSPEALRRHIDVLASDAFEGREPGTAGEDKAIAYIARQMQAMGLEPAGPEHGWYQPLKVVTRRPGDQSSRWQGKRSRLDFDTDSVLLVGRTAHEALADAPVVFAGYGMVGPEADLKGDVVLIRYDTPDGLGYPSFGERVRKVAARGAAAVIGIVGPALPWPVVQRVYDAGQHRLDIDPPAAIQGVMTEAAAAELFRIGRAKAKRLTEPGAARLVPLKLRATLDLATRIETIATRNVVGRLRGAGSMGESLLYLAHWDHLGICAPDEADRICNGAVDNASGVAAMLEVARGLAQGPRPRRDVIVLATTAEEMGLLGAEYFAARPVVPLGSLVAAINLDTVAIAPRGASVAVMGRGLAPLDAVIDATVAEAGRTLDNDDEAAELVQRQDGWALARAGVPAIMIGGSFSDMKRLNAFLAGPYHSPSDNPGPGLELGGAAEDADLMIALGRKLADPDRYRRPAAR
jgi:hypothetical protein